VELEPERLEKKEVNVPKNKKIYAYITHERLRKDNPFLNACGSRAHIKVPKINPKAHFGGHVRMFGKIEHKKTKGPVID
jgi:hypothetical protein